MTDNIALLSSDRAHNHGDQLLHWAVTDTVQYLKAGRPDRALRRITESVFGEQARVAGIRLERT